MTITIGELIAPAAWASYYVNGDDSGLDEAEKAAADARLAQIAPAYVVDVERDENGEAYEPRFSWAFDYYGGLASGGDLLTYVTHERDAA